MSKFNPMHANSERTLAAATQWQNQCLIADKSMFSDRQLWTGDLLDELKARFIEQPDETKDRFIVKLKRQLEHASPDACRLMAELLWILNLFPSNIGPNRKRETFEEVWQWSGASFGDESPLLGDALLSGLGSAGPGFLAHRPREVRFLINAVRDFKSLDFGRREALLAEPWDFAQWLDDVPDDGYRQLKHIIPFLLFPDDFERIASPGDINRILTKVGGLDVKQLKSMSKVEKDRAIKDLRMREEVASDRSIDFYEPDLKMKWEKLPQSRLVSGGGSMAVGEPSQSAEGSLQQPLNQILYGPPGTGKTYHSINRALAILDPDFARANEDDRDALKSRFDELVKQNTIRFITFHQSFSYEEFVEGLKAEALSDGSIHYYVADGVLKDFCRNPAHVGRLATGTSFASGYTVLRSTDELLWIRKPNGSDLPLPWAIIDALRDLVISGDITVEDIRRKTVFDRVPDARLEKYIVNGYQNILPHIVEAVLPGEADTRANGPRVLIIDEINRGNVSKIFGELITLIEASKRAGSPEAITVTLPYSKEPFSLPNDLYLIGTMNTADRSLTTVDIALRRRFVFQEMEPDIEALDGKEIAGIDIAKLLDTINARIELLLDRDHRVGHAYFVGLETQDDITALRTVFRVQILPLLQEYFFDDWQRVRLVLNDHRKAEPADRFIIERDMGAERLFGETEIGVPVSKAWEINLAAFDRPSAYQGIYG